MSPARYKFRISGGLGNQLFAYYCALFASTKVDIDIFLDLASVDRSHYKDGVSLLSFNLAADKLAFTNSFGPNTRRNRYINRLMKEAKILTGLEKTMLFPPGLDSKQQFERFLFSGSYFDPRTVAIEGCFSDFSFFDGVPREFQTLKLKNPSGEFDQLSEQMRNQRTLAIHHRLGDFTELGSSVGILSSEFYKEALELVCNSEIKKILVFSNDPENSKSLFRNWGIDDSRISWIGPEELPDPAETLLLMSMANSIICSNSTFSYWAAKLSSTDVTSIYYPHEFRRDNLANVLNIPGEWKPLDSRWHS